MFFKMSFAPTGPLKTCIYIHEKTKEKERNRGELSGLILDLYFRCDYHTQSSALSFEKNIFIRNS